MKTNLLGSRGGESARGELVAELVMDVGDAGGAFLGEGARDAVGDFRGVGGGGDES